MCGHFRGLCVTFKVRPIRDLLGCPAVPSRDLLVTPQVPRCDTFFCDLRGICDPRRPLARLCITFGAPVVDLFVATGAPCATLVGASLCFSQPICDPELPFSLCDLFATSLYFS